jgi:hypothetical protein
MGRGDEEEARAAVVGIRREQFWVLFLAVARTAYCAYRAVHDSITIDEAYTFNQYLSGPWSNIWSLYEANNHVLYSILAKASVGALGLSEWTLRLPSLLAGFFLMLGVYAVLRETVESRWIRWVALGVVALHPLLLDLSVAARGYVLAMALLVWAMYFLLRKQFELCGVAVGFALSANLVIFYPVAGFMLAVLIMGGWRTLAVVVAISETLFIAVSFGVLRHATPSNFYFGHDRLREMVMEALYLSLRGTDHNGIFGRDTVIRFLAMYVVPLIGVYMLASARFVKMRTRLLPLGILIVCGFGILATRFLLHVKYPMDRTAAHLILLFVLAWAVAADSTPRLRWAQVAIGILVIAQMATQFQPGYIGLWAMNRHDRTVAERIRDMSRGHAAGSMKVSVQWEHQSCIEFYRQSLPIPAIEAPDWVDPMKLEGFDFYVMKTDGIGAAMEKGIRIVYQKHDVALGVN